jgi:putative oxidoreductase
MEAMTTRRLQASLMLLRLTVFLVMLMWTLDKIVNPDHAAKVFESFYFIGGLGAPLMKAIGVAELLVILAFVAGLAKRWTYGFVLLAHAVSTLSSFRVYLDPFASPNLLFFAAWPMLAACVTLYLLRDEDRLASLGR